jgi:hypothetical protein
MVLPSMNLRTFRNVIIGALIGAILGGIPMIPIGGGVYDGLDADSSYSYTKLLAGFELHDPFSVWQILIGPAIGMTIGALVAFAISMRTGGRPAADR